MSSSDRRYNGYRSGTLRLDEWDYRRSAWYFVTICTHNCTSHFGTVRNGIVGLSPAGCIAAYEWRRTPEVRPYVRLGAWIVMPNRPKGDSRSERGVNYVHGLIGITTESPANDVVTGTDTSKRDGSNAADDADNSDGVDASRRACLAMLSHRLERTSPSEMMTIWDGLASSSRLYECVGPPLGGR